MSTIKLGHDVELDPMQIESISFSRKGAEISAKVVSVPSGQLEPLTVPEDVLIVRLNDASEISVRGEEAQNAFDLLGRIQHEQGLKFDITVNDRQAARD